MKSLFQALVNVADGAFIIDKDQRIIFWNQAAQEILGHSYSEVLNQPCYKILAGHDEQCQPICREHCRAAMTTFSGGTVKNYDMCVQTKPDNSRWINMSTILFPNGDDGSGFPVLVHLFRDATQKKQTEKFLHQMLETAKDLQDQSVLSPAPSSPAEPAITDLTDREREVLSLLAQGFNTNKMAESLSISPATVRNHVRNIRQKLHVHSKLEAVVYAFKYGLVSKD